MIDLYDWDIRLATINIEMLFYIRNGRLSPATPRNLLHSGVYGFPRVFMSIRCWVFLSRDTFFYYPRCHIWINTYISITHFVDESVNVRRCEGILGFLLTLRGRWKSVTRGRQTFSDSVGMLSAWVISLRGKLSLRFLPRSSDPCPGLLRPLRRRLAPPGPRQQRSRKMHA